MKESKVIWMFNHYAVTSDIPGGTRHYDFAKEVRIDVYRLPVKA